jgi:hypothetical protein
MYKLLRASFALLASLLCVFSISAAEVDQEEIPVNLSYIYAPLLGTGYYKAGAERAFVLKLSLEDALAKSNPEKRFRWLLPVTLGLRKTEFAELFDLGDGLPDKLHSVSVMPGLAWDFHPGLNWQVTPSVQLGVARDFSLNTTTAIYSANLRGLRRWKIGGNTLSWGNRARAAGQYNYDLKIDQGFVLLETGLDWEFTTPMRIANRAVSFSVYSQLQAYLPDIGIRRFSGEHVDAKNLLYLGLTAGLDQPRRVLGFPIQRLGISLAYGENLRGITLNLGFPLFVD